MKYSTYLSLSSLIIVSTASSTSTTQLRGSEEDITAPPRIFEEQSLHNNNIESPQSLISTHQEQRALQNCNSNQQSLRITLNPDEHTNTDNEFTISIRQNDGTWQPLGYRSGELRDGAFTMCLSSGRYKFEAIDSYSDGVLGGGYEVKVDGSTIFSTPRGQWSRMVHKFNVDDGVASATAVEEEEEEEPELQLMMASQQGTGFPTSVVDIFTAPKPAPVAPKPTKKPTPKPTSGTSNPPPPAPANIVAVVTYPNTATSAATTVSTGTMTEREHQWLDEHNTRRQKYHTKKGKSYQPLKWSKFLKDQSQQWAEECARTGNFDHAWHLNIGENMARHTTSGNGYRHPSNILTRWVENEMDVGYPENGHMTQALWRATEYVGCGEAKKGNRYYQVCQYSKPGNCGVKSDYWSSVLADDSGCAGMPLDY
mmetsp:Transcript_32904/g.49585  ORF Transcript_32904/g.49585 Transcript_32904/m.49585 type:complete len:425 (-) Transcript_32904:2143-3417(-)